MEDRRRAVAAELRSGGMPDRLNRWLPENEGGFMIAMKTNAGRLPVPPASAKIDRAHKPTPAPTAPAEPKESAVKKTAKKAAKAAAKKTPKPKAAKAAKPKKQNGPDDARHVAVKVNIGSVAREAILAGKTNEEALAAVKKAFPDGNTNAGNISWYRNDLRKKGLLPRPTKQAPAGAEA